MKFYKLLKKKSIDITSWIVWFLENMSAAIVHSEELLKDVIRRTEFWNKNKTVVFNERQIKVLKKLLENFESKLTTQKWAKICNCSHDTANRDIIDLINKNILVKLGEARATHYVLK